MSTSILPKIGLLIHEQRDVLLARCSFELVGGDRRPLTPERRTQILNTNEALAGDALRALGVAFRRLPPEVLESEEPDGFEHVEHDLVFAGLIGMIDPPRPEAKAAVERAKAAGIRPIMITGDHPRTAAVIAQELGIAPDGPCGVTRRGVMSPGPGVYARLPEPARPWW